jgi:hypothetical protein
MNNSRLANGPEHQFGLHILWPFSVFCGVLILILVYFTKENLATPANTIHSYDAQVSLNVLGTYNVVGLELS